VPYQGRHPRLRRRRRRPDFPSPQGLGTVAALVRGGQVRLIGVTTQTGCRNSQMCHRSESGLPDSLQFLVRHSRPRRTPKDIIARLNAEALQAAAIPTFAASSRIWVSRCVEARARSLRVMTRDQLAKYGA